MLELSNSVVVNNSGIAEWDNSVVVEMNIHIYIPVRLTNILVSNTSFILLFCSVPYFVFQHFNLPSLRYKYCTVRQTRLLPVSTHAGSNAQRPALSVSAGGSVYLWTGETVP